MMDDALGDLVKNTLLVVGALFPIVNPIATPQYSYRSRVGCPGTDEPRWRGWSL